MQTVIMPQARMRAVEHGVTNIVVTLGTGHSIRAAMDAFGDGYRFFAVGNDRAGVALGLPEGQGVADDVREELEARGVTVILDDLSVFQAREFEPGRPEQVERFARSYQRRTKRAFDPPALTQFTNELLTFLFSDGPRLCVEVAMMAADSGLLPLDEDCIVIATPSRYCDLPDAAVILRPARSDDFWGGYHGEPGDGAWSEGLMIKDVLMAPAPGDWWMKPKAAAEAGCV